MTKAQVSEPIKVATVVSQEQVDFYVDNGFLAVPDLLSANELDELKQDIIKLARGGYPNQTIRPVADDLTDEEVLSKLAALSFTTAICSISPSATARRPVIDAFWSATI